MISLLEMWAKENEEEHRSIQSDLQRKKKQKCKKISANFPTAEEEPNKCDKSIAAGPEEKETGRQFCDEMLRGEIIIVPLRHSLRDEINF